MGVFYSIDGWDDFLKNKSIELLKADGILIVTVTGELAFSEHANSLAEAEDWVSTHKRWLSWGAAVEYLLKSVFIKHFPDKIITKGKPPQLSANSSLNQYIQTYWDGVGVFSHLKEPKWDFLDAKGIKFDGQIKTGTLWSCADQLNCFTLNKAFAFDSNACKLLKDQLKVFAGMHRNRLCHAMGKNQTKLSTGDDIQLIMIPAINTLIRLFNTLA